MRGTIKNTVIWGIGWAVLGFATNMVMRTTGIINAPISVFDSAVVGLKVGLGGAIAGVAFSAFIAFAYRNRRIQEISWLKFGVGGAVVTVASITIFVQGASLLGGGRLIEWHYMQSTLAMFAAFGFSVAAISMKLAQLAQVRAISGSLSLSVSLEQ
ncbi:MAG: hypothetical protein V4550_03440 [Gemmatimonadota bacterium]